MEKQKVYSKPRTLKQLAAWYETDYRQVKQWLEMVGEPEPDGGGYKFSIKQIQKLCERFGEPD